MILQFKAPKNIKKGTSVKEILKSEFNLSSRRIAKLKTQKGMHVNGKDVFTTYELKPGDSLEVNVVDKLNSDIKPENVPLDFVYDDKCLSVINKPVNMPVHTTSSKKEGTLANALIYHWIENNETSASFHIVTRLDMNTSGLLIIAKNGHIHNLLEQQLIERKIERRYIAIVEGFIKDDDGRIDVPIGRPSTESIAREALSEEKGGQRAVTNYWVKQRFLIDGKQFSLVELKLDTGRTHQIRVHMKHIGHPLVGDTLYNPTSTILDRHALHAYKIKFFHPLTLEPLEFESEIPNDMNNLINLKR